MKDDFGDRMKRYEAAEAGRRAMQLLPICVRIDGKCFSSWTRGLDRPFDSRFSAVMVATTGELVKESGARIGYTQSDEISLVLAADEYGSEILFDGKLQKLVSVLASIATASFNDFAGRQWIGGRPLALFDCRVWTVPNRTEAANVILWREKDATKNSISMAARAFYSHRQLFGKSAADMQEMLHEKGVNWNDYPTAFKRGVYVRRVVEQRPLSEEERERIPEAHRSPAEELVSRSSVKRIEMPVFGTVTNREAVVFDGADPTVRPL